MTLPYYFSVMDAPYNAAGDGVTDDTAAVQAALTAAAAANSILFFPIGRYLISATLTLPAGFAGHLAIAGVSMQQSVLLFKTTGNGLDLDLSTSSTYVFLNSVDIANLSVLAVSPAGPSGLPIRINYGTANGTGAETNPGSSLHNICIGTVMTGDWVQSVAGAGWSGPITCTVCHNLDITRISSYGSGGNTFPAKAGAAGSGSLLSLLSCVNASVQGVYASSWGNVVNLGNAGGGLSDCQGITLRGIRGVTCGSLLTAIGLPAPEAPGGLGFPNSLSAITLDDWMLDNGYGGTGAAYQIGIQLTNAAQVKIGKGWMHLANGGPFIWLTNCANVGISQGDYYLETGNQIGIFVSGGSYDTAINGNTQIEVPGGEAVYVDKGSLRTIITSNSLNGSRIGVTDLGTATIQGQNQPGLA